MPRAFHVPSRRSSFRSFVLLIAISVAVVACGGAVEEEAAEPAATPEPQPVTLDRAALQDPSRPEAEVEQDAGRRPIDVYEFFGVQPGQTVADVYNSDGYNSHLLSRVVGSSGHVYSVFEFYSDPEFFDGELYKVDAVTERVNSAGLSNVELANHMSELPADSVDVAVAIRNYHDVEWLYQGLTRAAQTAEFFRIVKPGGFVGIVEVATPNEGWDNDAHRLNKQVVIDDFTAAGFELVDESDMLANPDDDHSGSGFETGRHLADRYILKFRRPSS